MSSRMKTTDQVMNKALWDEKDAWRIIRKAPNEFPEIKKTIAEGDTPEQLTEESTPCYEIGLQANKNNTSTIYVGPSTVDEDSYALEPGNSLTIVLDDASLVYVYGKTGDKIVALYTNHSIAEEE